MRGILTGRRGLAPALLVLVLVWALVAVLLLTGTITAANRIDKSVKVIKPEVGSIKGDSKNIALAKKTAKISGRIKTAATPLTGELNSTIGAARNIDGTAKSILLRVLSINNVAGAINGNVRDINTTVHGIDSNVSGINANTDAINANAKAINASARSINSRASSINSDVKSIRGRAGRINTTAISIDGRVSGINARAVAARGVVALIKNDLDAILKGALSINNHANQIDCSNLINKFPLTPVPGSTGCQR